MIIKDLLVAKAALIMNYKKSILDRASSITSTTPTNLEKAQFEYDLASLDYELAMAQDEPTRSNPKETEGLSA